eukprot:gene8636-11672_t
MTSSLNEEIEKDVVPWLNLVEDLRLLKLEVDLNIPQICVMGDQSSGKSSVLEALSGIPFPRGSGLVTRCPIRLVMRRSRPGEAWSALVSTSVNPNKRSVKDIPELSTLMERLTEELCIDGSNSFSTESIIVELTSPDCSDLTVVDLPGIIRTVTAGQSVSSIEQVNRLIKSFLMDPRTIILAVIPANQDIATIDILEKANRVDPSGERTIGVLTKVDLIGPGNEDEVLSVVNNVRKPLALGYIMLKNRSQRDIMEKMSTSKARELEIQFFANHSIFRGCNPKLYGIAQLSKRLTHLLVNRIQSQLTPMKIEVDRQLVDVRSQLRLLPSSYATVKTTSDRQKLLVSIVQEYIRHLTDCIRGEYRDRIMVRNAELRMYTKVLRKFEEFQFSVNSTAPKFKQDDFIELLSLQIEQLRGRELPGFMSSQAFYMCMSQYVDTWRDPMKQLVQDVHSVAVEISNKLADILLSQYPGLRDALHAITENILTKFMDEVTITLEDNIIREKDPFTLNDFLQQWVNKIKIDRFSQAIDNCFDNVKSPGNNWNALKEEVFVNMRHWYRTTHSVSALASAKDMSAIMEAYWNLSAKRFIDNCCMMIDKEMLGKLPSAIQDQMYPFIRDDKKLENLPKKNGDQRDTAVPFSLAFFSTNFLLSAFIRLLICGIRFDGIIFSCFLNRKAIKANEANRANFQANESEARYS